ncbi:MAG: trehalose-phosphatase [Planctomycetaceae bacterium]
MQDGLDQILGSLHSHPAISLCLDYDGTLVPIQSRPELCWLNPTQKDLLRALATHPKVRVSIVTGRSMEDIEERVGIQEIIYAANHGLEILGLNNGFQIVRAAHIRESLQRLAPPLEQILQLVPGCWVEDKGLSATVHFRGVVESDIPRVSHAVEDYMMHWPEFIIRHGKRVLEIRPRVDWNKSHAVRWIGENAFADFREPLTIFCGDDVTDHDVFRELPSAMTIQVGECHICAARCCVADPNELWSFLKEIAGTLQV